MAHGTEGQEIVISKYKVILGTTEKYESLLKEKLQEIEQIEIWDQGKDREELMRKGEENLPDIIFITTDLPGEEINWMTFSREVNTDIRILAIDTENLNRLIIGKMQENGVEFIEEMEQLEEVILRKQKEEDETEEVQELKEDSKESGTEDEQNENVESSQEPQKKEKDKKVKRGKDRKIKLKTPSFKNPFEGLGKKETISIKQTPEVQAKEIVRTVETTKHHVVEKVHIQKELVVAPDYQKVVGVIGCSKVGKSFLAAALLKELDQRKKYAAGLDLTDTRDLYHYFGPEEKSEKKEKVKEIIPERSLLDLLKGSNNPWLESRNISLYLANPKIEMPRVDGNAFMQMRKLIMADNHVCIADMTYSIEEEKQYCMLERLMLCDQVIFVVDPDPLRIDEQIDFFRSVTEVVETHRILIFINFYTKGGYGKHRIRKRLQEIRKNISEIYTLEINSNDLEYARKCLMDRRFKLDGFNKKTRKVITEIGERIYPG